MPKRTQQQPPKKPKSTTKGVQVKLEDGGTLDFTDAVGWNFGQDGILFIASPEKIEQQQNNQTVLVNGLLASFRRWAYVKWL